MGEKSQRNSVVNERRRSAARTFRADEFFFLPSDERIVRSPRRRTSNK